MIGDELYTLFTERNSSEGEKWLVFVKQNSNEYFIKKMKCGIELQYDENQDNCINLEKENVAKFEVDVLLSYNDIFENGYFDMINVVDGSCDPDRVDISSAENFHESTYKLSCFKII